MASSHVVFVFTLLLATASIPNVESLRFNHYKTSCPSAEATIAKIVTKAIIKDKRVGAGLLRLFFHDCAVEGCDASVLIDSPTHTAEKDAIPNQTLHSLEVIDEAKAAVESLCYKTVSCADIIAYAAATSVYALGGLKMDPKGGRYDGLVSTSANALSQIPAPFFNISTLQANFAAKGLDNEDLVVLSGAHSIGKGHCSSFDGRLRNFSSTSSEDPSLNAYYAKSLKKACPLIPLNTTIVNLDPKTPVFFDNAYYQDVTAHRGLFISDAALLTSPVTRKLVKEYAVNNADWLSDFSTSLFKMGKIGIKTKHNGNIRTNCRSFT